MDKILTTSIVLPLLKIAPLVIQINNSCRVQLGNLASQLIRSILHSIMYAWRRPKFSVAIDFIFDKYKSRGIERVSFLLTTNFNAHTTCRCGNLYRKLFSTSACFHVDTVQHHFSNLKCWK